MRSSTTSCRSSADVQNDTFVKQIVDSAQAAVDKGVAGVVDRDL
jgi:hypothetical protein